MPASIDYEFIQETWPTLSSMTYLNTASTGVPTKPAVDAMADYMKKYSEKIWGYEHTADLFTDVRTYLSQLLGGDYSQYAFIPSTSIGLNSFGHAIEYPEGSNVVICDLEFPSNFLPWQNISKLYGVELRVAKSHNGEVSTDAFIELVDENTRVVAVSHVQFGSGYKSDLKSIAKAVHSQGGYLAADIIQSAGWSDFDLVDLEVDFAASQATKWLAGPIGAGFIYIKKDVIADLHPRYVGWYSVKDHRDFSYYERELKDDASKFHTGSPPMAVYVGFRESLKIMLQISSGQRESVALDNASYLRKRLSEEGIEYYDFGQEHNSPIVSCNPPNVDGIEVQLRKDRIFCSERDGRLRISPHFYNTYEEIDRIVDRIR
ncbi:MAG: aminotransferase class V-fold PLP-dependent enzyme [Candidatus Thorarchaeota archaeon]